MTKNSTFHVVVSLLRLFEKMYAFNTFRESILREIDTKIDNWFLTPSQLRKSYQGDSNVMKWSDFVTARHII